MHANVQTRFNPATGEMAPYYRIKESYRDVQGHVHSLILLNIGFEPSLTAVQVRKIAYALTERFKNRSTPSLLKEHIDGLTPIEQPVNFTVEFLAGHQGSILCTKSLTNYMN